MRLCALHASTPLAYTNARLPTLPGSVRTLKPQRCRWLGETSPGRRAPSFARRRLTPRARRPETRHLGGDPRPLPGGENTYIGHSAARARTRRAKSARATAPAQTSSAAPTPRGPSFWRRTSPTSVQSLYIGSLAAYGSLITVCLDARSRFSSAQLLTEVS